MVILFKLLLAHFVGDFLLQPKSWVREKESKRLQSGKLYFHFLLHGVLALILLWDISLWLLALSVTAVHAVIDVVKLYSQTEDRKALWFLLDQTLHITAILILWMFWVTPDMQWIHLTLDGALWIYLTAFVFLTSVSGILIQMLLSNWAISLGENHADSLVSAGKYIGILERLFVFTFVVTGNWDAIGFLLAAKSVFRFGDLKESKDKKLTEYILVGTLLSFSIAVAVGLIVQKLTT